MALVNASPASSAERTALGTWSRDLPLPLRLLERSLACAAHGTCLLADAAFGRLFIGAAFAHFAEQAFALHLLLQNTQSLIDVIVAYRYCNQT